MTRLESTKSSSSIVHDMYVSNSFIEDINSETNYTT